MAFWQLLGLVSGS